VYFWVFWALDIAPYGILTKPSLKRPMIENCFLFLDRIGKKGEENLWKQGIQSWDDFLIKHPEGIKGISRKTKLYYDQKIRQAKKGLHSFDPSFFADNLPLAECWRLYRYFWDEAVFLDIETTGMGKHRDITIVGLFDGISTKTMVKGINLDYKSLADELKRYKILITYNGAAYDIPYLKRVFPSYSEVFQGIPGFPLCIPYGIPHIDLKNLCQKTGFIGGLKKIEKDLGIQRNPILDRLYGGDVLKLWKMWRASGDDYYLNLLVEYNEEDVINLKKIAELAVGKMEQITRERMAKVRQKESIL
jgi:uncharacterized protein